ncbi:RNase H family protein [Butyrivibrio sp.]|uniref:RNase H family protein n=1 Tax=Butyrivibrio sp. TaxID=28121 RepID=UPI0025C5206D|nr:RNase H family protein [Butyrivibrio sp.]MBQ9302058.1 hypothetical protein [Butyrivibrio sp.]
MEKINIYVHTNIKSVKAKAAGLFIWIIEFMTAKGPATLTGREEITATWKEAELMAIVKALGRLKKPCELTIFTGNVQVAAALHNAWYKKWAESGYTNSKGETIENADRWKELAESIEKHTVLAATSQSHSYTSWMISELGEEAKESESQISTARRTLEDIQKAIESLDISTVEENPLLTKLVMESTEMLFEKFVFLRNEHPCGFVKIENQEIQQIKEREPIGKNETSEIMVH